MIESRKNRLVKDIRRLRRRKGDHLLLEGPHLVGEALATGLDLEWVLATPAFLAHEDGELLASRLPITATEIAPRVLDAITDSDSPRGILALARLARGSCTDLPVSDDAVYLYLAGVQDPGNLGALARVAEATSVSGLALSADCVHPNHPRALRASAGSLLRVPVAIDVDPEALDRRLGSLRPCWVGLTPTGGDSPWEADLAPPLVLVVGAERGLSAEIREHCDRWLTIPMARPVESLNTAVAAAVTLFAIRSFSAGRPR